VQVTRNRRVGGKLRLPVGRKARVITATSAALLLALTGTSIAYASSHVFGTDQVGTTVPQGLVLSDNQIINPYGTRLVIPNGKIMGSAISPDGTRMAATLADGSADMVIINLSTMAIQQYVRFGKGVGQESPTYSPDGTQLWMGTNTGYAKYTVAADGSISSPVNITIPTVNGELPLVGKAVFSADGSTVYAAVNGQNTVVALNASTGDIKQTWNVGNAPRDLLLAGGKLYVSNEGGRTATSSDTTLNSDGTQVPASELTGSTTTGTVSVIDLSNPTATPASIAVGLHPTALYYNNGALFVANTNSDTVSVIDAQTDKVVQTIGTQPWPEAKVGYEPDAITMTDDGHLLVSLGGANAIAVYKFDNQGDWTSPRDAVNYIGLIPTDYFPAELANVNGQIVVTNMRGIDARRSTTAAHGTHDTTSSLTHFTMPSDDAIRAMTEQVFQDNGWTPNSVKYAGLNAQDVMPVPVPTRIGAPSTIKYVFLVVKENRTYDQVLGDMSQGNGNPAFTQYGAAVTPNNHALATQFGLYDNFYDAGTNSAEGHNWLMQADNPDYTQSLAGQYDRSYDTEDDALGHQASGTLWSGVEAAGKTAHDLGEFQQFLTKPAGASWQNLYCDSLNMDATGAQTAYKMTSSSPIPSLNNVSNPLFPKFDTSVPDIYRYEIWKQDFAKNGPSNLNMFWLSSDHTGGPASPAAQVADNDLALGKIVETISHSKYWPQSAIFVVEDDSQAGLDHVDGHRAPIQVISPWAQHGVVNNTYYTQVNMIRTIENILGMHPMNQKDSAATPMYGAFTSKPDFTPYTAVDNQTSLTAGLQGGAPSCGLNVPGPLLAGPTTSSTAITATQKNAAAIAKAATQVTPAIPAAMQTIAAQWAAWLKLQHTTGGTNATPDYANPEQMNRYDWYANSNFTKPYPGDSKIYAPNLVPGVYLASSDNEG
jgi:YVTN family beta-propeller protein